jgi:hypothetical protein
MNCQKCKRPLPKRGRTMKDYLGVYVARLCSCGHVHKTRFGKRPVQNRVVVINFAFHEPAQALPDAMAHKRKRKFSILGSNV